jgi:hypothetical protein
VTLGQLWTFLGIALPALAALLVPMPAVDLAYQLRAGADILGGRGIPVVDAWTFTAAGRPWLDQQWGAQAALAAVFQAAGWTGLVLLRAALVAATFLLLTAALRSLGCGRRPAALLSLASFAVAAPALALRPQLFAMVLFAATLWLLVDRERHPGRVWLVPLLALAWANLHGTFPLALVLVGLAGLDELVRTRRVPVPLVAVGLATAAATLVNPFGIDVWRYVVNLAANPAVSQQVSEWRPPSPLDPAGAIFFLSLGAAAVVAWLRIRADGRVRAGSLAPIATLLAFGALGVLTGRGLAWWALVLPVAGAQLAHGASLTERLPARLQPVRDLLIPGRPEREARRSRLHAWLVAVLVLAAVVALPPLRATGPAGVPNGILSFAPQGIAAALGGLAERGTLERGANVWNPQPWGSWLEYAVPELDYAVDSRIELFPPDLWPDVQAVAGAQGEWLSILDRRGVDAVVVGWEQTGTYDGLLASSAWMLCGFVEQEGWIWLRATGDLSLPAGCVSTPG